MPIVWLPIALHWLPTTRFFISRAPNLITRLEVDLQPIHRLPALASCIRFYLKSIVIRSLSDSHQIIKLTNLSAFQQSNIEISKAGQPPIQIGVVPNILSTFQSQFLGGTIPRLETSIQ